MLKARLYRLAFRLAGKLLWRNKPQGLTVTDHEISAQGGAFPVRVYRPVDESKGLPAILYFHGGGFVLGDIEAYDGPCRDLAVQSRCLVVSVGYRLAPEHRFPRAVDDCLCALDWLVENLSTLDVNPAKVIVAGDSAGGNLAAVVAQQARATHPNLVKGQILIYPVTDHYSAGMTSYDDNATGQGLTRKQMEWFWDSYYPKSAVASGHFDVRAMPLRENSLADLPPALVITAERDPLRDEGRAYAEKLKAQGIAVRHIDFADLQHGFIGTLGRTENHQRGMNDIVDWLNELFV